MNLYPVQDTGKEMSGLGKLQEAIQDGTSISEAELRAEIESDSWGGYVILNTASDRARVDVLQMLHRIGLQFDEDSNYLQHAIWQGQPAVLHYFLDLGAAAFPAERWRDNLKEALQLASIRRDTELIRKLIPFASDPSELQRTMDMATMTQNRDTFHLLLRHQVLPSQIIGADTLGRVLRTEDWWLVRRIPWDQRQSSRIGLGWPVDLDFNVGAGLDQVLPSALIRYVLQGI